MQEILWTISNITAGTVAQIDEVFAAGFLPILCEELYSSPQRQKQAIWAVLYIHLKIHNIWPFYFFFLLSMKCIFCVRVCVCVFFLFCEFNKLQKKNKKTIKQ